MDFMDNDAYSRQIGKFLKNSLFFPINSLFFQNSIILHLPVESAHLRKLIWVFNCFVGIVEFKFYS